MMKTETMERIAGYEIHPAASVFPLMEGEAFDDFVADVKANGLLEPVWRVWVDRIGNGARDALILDGRNRLRACEAAKVKPTFRDYEGESPWSFVASLNLKRRDLTTGQKAAIGVEMLSEIAKEIEAIRRQRIGASRVADDKGRGERFGAAAADQIIVDAMETASDPRQSGRGAAAQSVARSVGTSRTTIESAKRVHDNAAPEVWAAVKSGRLAVDAAAQLTKLPEDKQRAVLARSDTRKDGDIRGGLVRAYVKQETKAETARQIEAEPAPMPAGPFRVIVADPPWAYTKREGDASHRGDLPYPSMTTDAICALDVAAITHPQDAILWLWTTNAFMRDAYRVLDAWGFKEKTILTWAKDRMGLGDWLRGQTEHCILAVKGSPTVTLTNETTLLPGPVREHSRKPDEFYALVERLCPGAKVEMFCRTPRPGWAKWGAETEKFHAA
jgi:N6-adenosine-specific RNA methylase IME4